MEYVEEAAESFRTYAPGNEDVGGDFTVAMQIPGLEENIEPYVLDNTPNVLSVGM